MRPRSLAIWCFVLFGWLGAFTVAAQTFDVEQFDQLFRPRLKIDAHHQPQCAFRDTTGSFSSTNASAVVTFPIHARFQAGLRLDSNARSFGELISNAVQVKASQVLGSVRVGARQVELGFDEAGMRQLYTASAGLMGMKLTKRRRVLLWSANMNVSEEDATIQGMVPRFHGLISKLHVKGLRRSFFYGLALAYSDRLALPIPFIGGTAPLSGDWSFQYVLPAQVALGFEPRKHTKFMMGVSAEAFRSGVEWHEDRTNLNYGAFRTFVNLRHKANDRLQLRADISYALAQTVRFSDTEVEPNRYPVDPGISFGVGVNVLFGGSVLERVVGEVLAP